MAEFTILDEAAAPPAPRTRPAVIRRMREYEGYVASVRSGRVGKLQPAGPDETPRGLALRITRAGRRLGRRVRTWIDGDIVYFRVD